MKRDKHAIKPKTSARPARTIKLNVSPKATNLCVNCAQPRPWGREDLCAACLENVDVIAEFPF